MQHHIFLAYSRKDADIMNKVRDTFARAGMIAWADDHLTPGSDTWSAAVQDAIENAGCMVVLLTPDAHESRWVMAQLNYAAELGVAIFPVLARGNERDSVPSQLLNSKRINVQRNYEGEMAKLVQAIHHHISMTQTQTSPNRATVMLKTDLPTESRKPWRWIALAVVLVAVVAGAIFLLLNNTGEVGGIAAVPSATAPVAVLTNTPGEGELTSPPTNTVTATPTFTATPATPFAQPIREISARSGPGSEFPAVATIPADSAIGILGISEDGDWLRILLEDGAEAWITSSELVVQQFGDLAALQVVILPSDTPTPTDTFTPAPTDTPTFTLTPTLTPTETLTPTPVPTATSTATFTPTPTPTSTPTSTPTPTDTPTITPTSTPTPEPPGRFPYVNTFSQGNPLADWSFDPAIWRLDSLDQRDIALVGVGTNRAVLDAPAYVLNNATPDWLATTDMVVRFRFNIQTDLTTVGARLVYHASGEGYDVIEFFRESITLRQSRTPASAEMNRTTEPVVRTVAFLPLQNNIWHEVTVWIESAQTYVYVNGQLATIFINTSTKLPSGLVGLQVVGNRPVAFDDLVIQQAGDYSTRFDQPGIPASWQVSDSQLVTYEYDGQNGYLRLPPSVIAQPLTPSFNQLDLKCRLWNERDTYQIRVKQVTGGTLLLNYNLEGHLDMALLDGDSTVIWRAPTVRNAHGRTNWVDFELILKETHLRLYLNGVAVIDQQIPALLTADSIEFATGEIGILRLDDCLFLGA